MRRTVTFDAMAMRLEGLHHITAITGDAPGNVDFYARVLGLRMVKKTVNQDDPTVYHLFYADELGSPGSDITFFEYPGARRGRPGAGMVHRVLWRVASEDALAFWEERLRGGGRLDAAAARLASLRRPGGSRARARRRRERRRAARGAAPRDPGRARAAGVRRRPRLQRRPGAKPRLPRERARLRRRTATAGRCAASERGSTYVYDAPPADRGIPGAGTIHHVAWATTMEEHEAWHERVAAAGAMPSPIIDRFWFRSIYFREPSGVLFELATLGPGFTTDEPLETLGQALTLPPAFEHLRSQLEQVLTPLPEVTRVG